MQSSALRHDLFLLAHDDSGKPRTHRTTLGVGLAGALLIDLLMAGRVDVTDDEVSVYDRPPTEEPFADHALAAIRSVPNRHTAATWIGWLAEDAYERVRETLIASGVLHEATVRRLGRAPAVRYQPTNPQSVIHIHARTRYAVLGLEQPDPSTAALCALVAILRVESGLYVDGSRTDVLGRLEGISRASHPTIRTVVAAVDVAVASAATALYR